MLLSRPFCAMKANCVGGFPVILVTGPFPIMHGLFGEAIGGNDRRPPRLIVWAKPRLSRRKAHAQPELMLVIADQP